MMRNKMLLTVFTALVLALLAVALPAAPAAGVVGNISVTPVSGTVGTAVTLSGTGFNAVGSPTFTVGFDAISVATGSVAGDGSILTTVFIPAATRGVHNIQVTTNALPPDNSNQVTFTVNPAISFGTTSGFVGDQLSMTGAGFSGQSTVYITMDSISFGTAVTGSNGSFTTVQVTIPETFRGTHTIIANDTVGTTTAYTFGISPRLAITPTSGAISSQLTVTGNGYSASSNISFFIDDVPISTTAATASAKGSFTLSNFTIPSISFGSHTLKATDAGGGSAVATFSASQSMTISPTSGAAGTQMTISGKGFEASKNIAITFRGITALTTPPTVVSDAAGNFSASMTLPASAGGPQPIGVSDGTNSGSANFTVSSTSTINVNRGNIGTSVSVTGAGFNAGSPVVVRWDAAQVAQTTADATGAFSATFRVPPSKGGEHTVTVFDGTTTKNFTFTVTSTGSIGQTTGNIGSDISISGNGFNSGATVNITFDGVKISSATVDGNGNFQALFKAPRVKGGAHTVVASDGTNTLTSTWTMETTPPPAPLLIKPVNNTKGEPLADFIWTGVTDPSGVSYTFQLATDSNFNTVIVEKKELTNPGYKITENEKLKSVSQSQSYYWRVKATDDASNESEWSTPYSFYVGFIMPDWGLYAIAGAAVVVFFILGFWLGRRSTIARFRDTAV